MHQARANSSFFDIIDLDPYGSAAPFLDAAVQSISNGGLLCVTCTDMAVLSGNHSEACYAKYGSMPIKTRACHEMALRIILSSIEEHANRYKKYIVPLLSCSIDFYVRLFVRIYSSASEVKNSASKKAYIFQCKGCESFFLQPVGKKYEEHSSRKYKPSTGPIVNRLCDLCEHEFYLGGPLWADPIHQRDFIIQLLNSINTTQKAFGTIQRMCGFLTLISEVGYSLLSHILYEDLFFFLFIGINRLSIILCSR
jgi:tRNA (guanine26-N2/guanine27-N2)-dimethyltransferase